MRIYTNGGNFLCWHRWYIYHFGDGWFMKNISKFANDRFSLSFLDEMLPDSPGLWSITWEAPERASFMKLCHSQEVLSLSFSYLHVQETRCFSFLFPVTSVSTPSSIYDMNHGHMVHSVYIRLSIFL